MVCCVYNLLCWENSRGLRIMKYLTIPSDEGTCLEWRKLNRLGMPASQEGKRGEHLYIV